ncbi:UV DNA damage repair endonuclease UvsE [Bacillus andreraoultii]|uniref:UV DNA damage repair endonuclease UvsE n=1 Tax=Bacillus andreraoultii TaxID=1499685 RepID=UPI00053BBC24|nr:UV DNA damage repair endonuclease UvsE [Bacillus andreraoultii]
MKIQFGFVANALGLYNASPSKTMTFKRFSSLPKDERMEKLLEVTSQNIINTKRILFYLIAHEVKLYRFSSAMIPLATHPEVLWDYITPFKREWEELGTIIKTCNIRPSFHPNQFTLFTSPREEVTTNAVKDMEYHYQLLEAMKVSDIANINIHIGGAYGDKEGTLERFHKNIKQLPNEIKGVTTLENDDKTYNVNETLETCEREKIPMVLDYHHYIANKGDVELTEALQRIFRTWENRKLLPKVHISSPKSERDFRAHAEFVSSDFVVPFFKMARELNQDFVVMIEAKQKDLAMLKIVEDLTTIRGVKRISTTEIEW